MSNVFHDFHDTKMLFKNNKKKTNRNFRHKTQKIKNAKNRNNKDFPVHKNKFKKN